MNLTYFPNSFLRHKKRIEAILGKCLCVIEVAQPDFGAIGTFPANLPDPALLCFSHPLLMEHLESCCVSRKSDDAAKSWLPVQGGAICVIWRAREGGKMKMRERSPVTKSAAHFLPTSTSQFFSKFSMQPDRSNYQSSRARY